MLGFTVPLKGATFKAPEPFLKEHINKEAQCLNQQQWLCFVLFPGGGVGLGLELLTTWSLSYTSRQTFYITGTTLEDPTLNNVLEPRPP